MTPTLNGTPPSRVQRKSLADQLNRLDTIIDALDVGLSGAVQDAVREAVSTAVAETVRATLLEIVANPDAALLLRNLMPAAQPTTAAPAAPASAETRPTIFGRIRQSLSSAWRWSLSKVKSASEAIGDRIRRVRDGVAGAYRSINLVWRLKRPLLIALGIGVLIGMAGYFGSPWMAGVLSGLGAFGTSLGTQLALWAKRLVGTFSIG